ncbi:unnamed protein product [Adineta ricciae]|uniref:Uncharacterized protein n=1 Tax=Adineta ricciae TaxID=249248 RepID=A0A815AU07_ADIRI|nr:unnamed protein product [Adineta ricciae]
MSSVNSNIDKPLELIQKTYTLQATTTNLNLNHENSPSSRSSLAKISTHQPSRKSSVHDIHETTRDDLNKVLADIQSNLSRLKFLMETTTSVQTIREEFFKLKDHLLMKILEFISKLSNESTRRGSTLSKGNTGSLIAYHPQHLVYCIEHFRSELFKAKYLFNSLTNSSSIGVATLNNNEIKTTSNDAFDGQFQEYFNESPDANQIKRDISTLEEHAYLLTQRYYSQMLDWNNLDHSTITDERNINKIDGSNMNRFATNQLKQKLSTTSSMASFDETNFCSRIYQKCRNICCMCTPNYI